MAKDYYFILGVSRDATQRQIESAFSQHIRESGASVQPPAPLSELQEAYSVLANPVRRRAYDESQQIKSFETKQPVRGKPPVEPLIPGKSASDVIDVSLIRSFQTASPSFEEIHDRLWSSLTGAARPKGETIESLTIEIPITPQQALSGGTARVLIPAQARCPVCLGRGNTGLFVCLQCDGSGVVLDEYPLLVDFPAGVGDYAVQVPLDGFGIHNFYLNVCFRVTSQTIE
jgi:DnaJ-class molecular chaperone